MSKRNRGHSLCELASLVNVASQPPAVDDQLPAETAVAETAEESTTDPTESPDYVTHEDRLDPVEQPSTDACADQGIVVTDAELAADGPAIASIEAAEAAAAAPPIEAPPPTPDQPPVEDPTDLVSTLRAKIAALKAASAAKRVASGSKPRPNVVYTLLAKPPAWSSTPQVAQLQQILFDPAFLAKHRGADGSVKLSEPELFAQVVAGHAAGVLRTRQEPIRILQYYRSDLLNANCLRWA